MLPIDGVGNDLTEARANFGLLTVANRLDQQLTQRAPLELELAEHVEHLAAEGLPRLLELLQERAVDVSLARLLGHQVPEVADLGLPDAVDAPETLLDAVRVPWQVVVHHEMRALEVDAFARGVCGEEDLDLRIVPE